MIYGEKFEVNVLIEKKDDLDSVVSIACGEGRRVGETVLVGLVFHRHAECTHQTLVPVHGVSLVSSAYYIHAEKSCDRLGQATGNAAMVGLSARCVGL